MSIRTAVVLAAGAGVRLRPLTADRPKPMLPAANRPILEHVCDALVEAGVEQLVFVVGFRRERVQEHFGPSYRDVPVEYVVQEKQLGSGHALQQAEDAVSGPVLVVNGDRVIDAASVEEVTAAFEEGVEDVEAVLAVVERHDARQYGAVRLRDRDIDELVEKPDTDDYRLINAGIYAFSQSVFKALAETPRSDGELTLPDAVSWLIKQKRVRGVRTEGLWVDATYPWDLLAVASEVLVRGRAVGGDDSMTERQSRVWVADSARVPETATLRPPVVVGPDCELAAGAVVGPNAALVRNATVGANVSVERSVLDTDTRVDPGSVLVDTVTGRHVRIGAGVTVPGGPGDVRVDNEVFEDQQLGAVLADRAAVGGAASFGPGTLVGSGATVGPGVHVDGLVSDGAEVRR